MQNHFKQPTSMNIKATPIVEGKFWVLEENGEKVGILHKKENNKFMISSSGNSKYLRKEDLTKFFGKDFFSKKSSITYHSAKEVQGYPTAFQPHNSMYNVHKKLPLFTKSNNSKSFYCAGYYIIKFEKNWSKAYCPKLITLEKYQYQGPFKSEEEMKVALSNVKSN